MKKNWFTSLFALLLFFEPLCAQTKDTIAGYRIVDLETSGSDFDFSYAIHITSNNIVYGFASSGLDQNNSFFEVFIFASNQEGTRILGSLGQGIKRPIGQNDPYEMPVMTAFNDAGQGVGCSNIRFDPFYWSEATGKIYFFQEKNVSAQAKNITHDGTVFIVKYAGEYDYYLWSMDQGVRHIDIPSYKWDDNYQLIRMNDQNQLIGFRYHYIETGRPSPQERDWIQEGIIWNEQTGLKSIGRPEGCRDFYPVDSNAQGMVIGYSLWSENAVAWQTVKFFNWSEQSGFTPLKLQDNDTILPFSLSDNGALVVTQAPNSYYMVNCHTDTRVPLPWIGNGLVLNSQTGDTVDYRIVRMNQSNWITGTSKRMCPNTIERATIWMPIEVEARAKLMRGDVNVDGMVNITDAIDILGHLFLGQCMECESPGDIDDNGALNLTDAVNLLNYLFLGGPPPIGDPLSCSLGV